MSRHRICSMGLKEFKVLFLREAMQHTLDLRNAIVPFSLLKVIQALKMMGPGERLEVFWSDPDTPADLFKVLPDSAYDLIRREEIRDGEPSYRIILAKKQPEKPNYGEQNKNRFKFD